MDTLEIGDLVCRVRDLTVHYDVADKPVVAVNRIGFDVYRGEILGLVGESGCGKSTTAMAMLRLLQSPGRVAGGNIVVENTDIMQLSPAALRAFRWSRIALIPQGAMNALNPVIRVQDQLADAMAAHGKGGAVIQQRIVELLEMVGLSTDVRKLYPHELSGGMKQRVCIAMAVSLEPPLVIADEPTSALDVVVQRHVAQSLLHIKRTLGNSMIIIGHDMGLMAQLTDRLAVMYAGSIVEIAPTKEVFAHPLHPYTEQLIDSVPSIKVKKPLRALPGNPPDLRNMPPGCPFAPRCPKVMSRCHEEAPALREYRTGQLAACHLHEQS